jgi:hypothetical protein
MPTMNRLKKKIGKKNHTYDSHKKNKITTNKLNKVKDLSNENYKPL